MQDFFRCFPCFRKTCRPISHVFYARMKYSPYPVLCGLSEQTSFPLKK
ncbi:hypothetical protein HMPREF0889_0900 [Megasphaera lornae]|uniref:Uncharacterized protein n=1 Tax=Megasphaera lornae TaxID=1000568 RepID=D3LU36_9FIRM|nr:hypothetical protein HMPREF0889_0900 [Megasphaera genomosp. type_1 str. 28L]